MMTITTEQAELLARMADLNGPTRRGAALRSLAAERDALKSENARLREALKWRDAINDALTNWLLPIEDHETPKDALQRLIRLEMMAALDPKVSQAAADLVAKARRDALEGEGHE